MNLRGVLVIRRRPGVGGIILDCPVSSPDVFCFTEATSNEGSRDCARAADIVITMTRPVDNSRHHMGQVSTDIAGPSTVSRHKLERQPRAGAAKDHTENGLQTVAPLTVSACSGSSCG